MASIINASTSTGLVTTADTSGVLQLQTGGTAAVTVDASQNVGIGTSSPTFKLDVRGNMRLGDGVTAEQDIQFVASGGNWQVGTNNTGTGSTNRFYIYQDSTSLYRFSVDNGGRILMPYQPAFLAYLSAAVSASSGVQAVALNVEDFDIGNNFNTSNGRFTAPVAGTYQFNAIIVISTTTTSISYVSAEIRKNGSRYTGSGWNSKANTTNAYVNATASYTVYLSAGDYVELGTEISAALTLLNGITNGCQLSGHLVG